MEQQSIRSLSFALPWFNGVKTSDLVTFTRELATLNGAGISLIKSLLSLRDQMPQGKFRTVLSQVVDGIERGDSFSESLSHYPQVFSKLYVNMIKSGELSGSLEEILKRLAHLLEKQQRLKKRVRSALIYPIFVLSTAVLILTLLMIFVVPTFTKIFAEMESELPGPTRLLIGISSFFIHDWYFLIGGVIGLVYLIKTLLKIPICKYYCDLMLLRVPICGRLIVRVTLARMVRTLGTLLNSGVSILSALTIVKETTTNAVFANSIPPIMDSIKEGESLGKMFEQAKIYPNLLVKMVSVGEETGQLSDVLIEVADNYEEDVDLLIASLSSLMEPLLIVVMGLMVGFIVIAMFLPLFNLADML